MATYPLIHTHPHFTPTPVNTPSSTAAFTRTVQENRLSREAGATQSVYSNDDDDDNKDEIEAVTHRRESNDDDVDVAANGES